MTRTVEGGTRFTRVLVASLRRWDERSASTLSAAMAFYAMISLAPLITLAVGFAARALGEATVRAEVGARIQSLMEPRAAEVVLDLLQQGWLSQSSILGSIAAFIVIAYGSTTGFRHLKTSLDKIFGEPVEQGPALLRVLSNHAVSFLLVLLVGVSIVVLVSLEAAAAPVLSMITGLSPSAVVVLRTFKPALSLAVMTTLFCLMFVYLPERRPPWRSAALGALLTAVLFLVGQVLIGLYLARALFVSAFGVAGSLVALMAWSYYSCMIILLGAAVTAELVDFGAGPAEPSAPGIDEAVSPVD